MAKKRSAAARPKQRDAVRILIVEARFYKDISDRLLAGAIEALDAAGATYDIVSVPGALEVPGAIAMTMTGRRSPYDGAVALGCVIEGRNLPLRGGVE